MTNLTKFKKTENKKFSEVPSKMKQTEIGMIPEDWEVKELDKNTIDLNKKSIMKNDDYKEINYYDTSSITKGVFIKPVKFNILDSPSRAKRIAELNDILISTIKHECDVCRKKRVENHICKK